MGKPSRGQLGVWTHLPGDMKNAEVTQTGPWASVSAGHLTFHILWLESPGKAHSFHLGGTYVPDPL